MPPSPSSSTSEERGAEKSAGSESGIEVSESRVEGFEGCGGGVGVRTARVTEGAEARPGRGAAAATAVATRRAGAQRASEEVAARPVCFRER